MKQIKQIAEYIEEQVKDAEKYAKKALCYKEKDKQLADTYCQLSKQEIEHSNMLHRHVVRLIETSKNSGIEVPEAMQAVWDWQHEKMIENTACVKTMLDMYAKN